MNYEEKLVKLNDSALKKSGKIIKLLPDRQAQGFLDSEVKKEIADSVLRNKKNRSITELRAGVGWKNIKDVTKNKITISDETIRDIPVRRYNREVSKKIKPMILFIHGGGFFSGSLDNVDLPCKTIVDKTDIQVLSIDYRLAPENKYPSAIIDCQVILDEIYQNSQSFGIDPEKIYVMGDSAGGNLAFVTTIIDQLSTCNHICGQILVYPVLSLEPEEAIVDWKKYLDVENTGLLAPYFEKISKSTNQIYQWYAEGYDLKSKLISPLNSSSNVQFPRTLLVCGEYDFLKFQCEKFFEKFSKTNEITYIEYSGMNHAFMDKIGDYPQAENLCSEIAKFIERDDRHE